MFAGVSETAEALQYQMQRIGLNVKASACPDTATQLQYQLRPLPKNVGPIAPLIMHGNQAGDAAFTTSQYLLSDGPQSTFGTEELDRRTPTPARSSVSSARRPSPACSPSRTGRSSSTPTWPT
ncbi:hypothetical protein LV779_36550 [Streptomyces thinghirensis]|nr:hypothetical protein [Streptomyces thinghirensis]